MSRSRPLPLSKNNRLRTQDEDILRRLACVEGHVRAVKRMVEEDNSCSDILVQITAVRAALNHVGWLLLENHLRRCLIEAAQNDDVENALLVLKKSLDQYLRK